MPAIEAQTAKVWGVIERPEMSNDVRFATPEARIANEAACLALLHEALAEDWSANWERRFAAAGVRRRVLRLPDMLDDALAHRGTIKKPTRRPMVVHFPIRIRPSK